MSIQDSLRGAAHRWWTSRQGQRQGPESPVAGSEAGRRRTAALPSIFNTYAPSNNALPKRTPVNLRRFAETGGETGCEAQTRHGNDGEQTKRKVHCEYPFRLLVV